MDPNETLRVLRATAAQVHAEDGPLSVVALLRLVQHARDLAEHVKALDGWLTRGGFLPAGWAYGPAPSVTVTLTTGADAFRQEDGTLDRSEVARLLRQAADRISQDEGVLLDVNGNRAGGWTVREES